MAETVRGDGMTQLLFRFPRCFEVPAYEASWVEDGHVRRVYIGAHCADESWPWWKPWQPWEPAHV